MDHLDNTGVHSLNRMRHEGALFDTGRELKDLLHEVGDDGEMGEVLLRKSYFSDQTLFVRDLHRALGLDTYGKPLEGSQFVDNLKTSFYALVESKIHSYKLAVQGGRMSRQLAAQAMANLLQVTVPSIQKRKGIERDPTKISPNDQILSPTTPPISTLWNMLSGELGLQITQMASQDELSEFLQGKLRQEEFNPGRDNLGIDQKAQALLALANYSDRPELFNTPNMYRLQAALGIKVEPAAS